MEVLVTYDVSTETAAGRRRLRKVANICLGFGQRVQLSVFECTVTEVQMETMLHRLLQTIDAEQDSLRVYRLREPRQRYVKSYGRQMAIDLDKPLMI